MSSLAATFHVQNAVCANEAKVAVPILTGIGYLDHMIDQWNSHAQVGVGLEVSLLTALEEENNGELKVDVDADHNRFAGENQVQLCAAVGKALGQQLRKVLISAPKTSPSESRFCCPLDEALVECLISSGENNDEIRDEKDDLAKYSLAPYGIYPRGIGRTKIGNLETFAIESFWKALATSAGIVISVDKIRGDNAHHIGTYTHMFLRRLRCLI
jgi:imidazoleglycerol phosphate dehydratase HisB